MLVCQVCSRAVGGSDVCLDCMTGGLIPDPPEVERLKGWCPGGKTAKPHAVMVRKTVPMRDKRTGAQADCCNKHLAWRQAMGWEIV